MKRLPSHRRLATLMLLASSTLLAVACHGSEETMLDADGDGTGQDSGADSAGDGSGGDSDGGMPGDEPEPGDDEPKEPEEPEEPEEPAGEDEPYSIEAFDYVDSRPEDFHALPQADTTLVKSEELALFVPDGAGGQRGWSYEDRVEGPNTGVIEPGTVGWGPMIAAAHGDVDGDGRSEPLAARNHDGTFIDIVDIDDDGTGARAATIDVGVELRTAKIVAANLDGDLRDEIVIAGISGSTSGGIFTPQASHLRIYDDAEAQFVELLSETDPEHREIAIAAGDFDGDDPAELLVVTHGPDDAITIRVRDGLTETPTDHAVHDATLDYGPIDAEHDNQMIGAVAADFDGDGVDEPVVGALRRENSVGVLRLVGYELSEGGLTQSATVSQPLQDYTRSPYAAEWAWSLEVGDFNADRREEVVSNLLDHDAIHSACRIGHFSLNNDTLPTPYDQEVKTFVQSSGTSSQSSRCALAVLDDDRDARDAFVTAMTDPSDEDDRIVHMERYVASMDGKNVSRTETSSQTFPYGSGSSPIRPWLIGADLDGDSFRVVATGKKWLSLPHPRVLVVAAAPPTEKGISHNFTLTGTTYASSQSESMGQGETHTVHSSASVSFEVPVLFDIISAGVSAELTQSFNETHINTEEIAYGNSFVGGSDYDRVIFEGTLYMSYEYRIVAAPDPGLIGTRMTIDEPVDHKTYSWTLDYYNDQVAPEHRIGPEILSHTVGDVSSYKRAADKDMVLGQGEGLQTTEAAVDQGDGVRERFIELTSTNESEFTRTLDTTYTGGIGIPGADFAVSHGYEDGNVYTITVTEGVRYESAVGDILDTQEYTDYGFSYGMFVRNATGQDGAKFQVIDYWVSNLGPAH